MTGLYVGSDTPPPRPPRRVSFEDYLAAEQKAQTRSEYIDGVVRAMPGASVQHIVVNSTLREILGPRLRELGACRMLDQDVQIPVPSYNVYTYPDGAVACPPIFARKTLGALLNPKAIFEVLSPSTEAHDRGPKFRWYRSLETLEEYVLVSTTEPVVEIFSRTSSWGVRTYEGLDAVAELQSVGLELALRALYVDVAFEAPPV